jgi:RHS repeat-associated protein
MQFLMAETNFYLHGAGGTAKITRGSQGNEKITYIVNDRLGNQRLLLDGETKEVIETYKALPYGQQLTDNKEIKYGFTGKEEDESGLHYFNARYYDADMGKFTSVDPVEDNHAYSYVSNNPFKYTDPSGMFEHKAEFFIEPYYGSTEEYSPVYSLSHKSKAHLNSVLNKLEKQYPKYAEPFSLSNDRLNFIKGVADFVSNLGKYQNDRLTIFSNGEETRFWHHLYDKDGNTKRQNYEAYQKELSKMTKPERREFFKDTERKNELYNKFVNKEYHLKESYDIVEFIKNDNAICVDYAALIGSMLADRGFYVSLFSVDNKFSNGQSNSHMLVSVDGYLVDAYGVYNFNEYMSNTESNIIGVTSTVSKKGSMAVEYGAAYEAKKAADEELFKNLGISSEN